MNKKEKMTMLFMTVLFLIAVGLYGYNQYFVTETVTYDEIEVLVAAKDVNQNEEINADTTIWKKIDKKYLAENAVTKETPIDGKVINSNVFKGEYITTSRIGEANVLRNSLYEVNVQPTFSSTLKANDLVRVYVQIVNKDKNTIESYLLFDKKVVGGLPEVENAVPAQINNQFISLKLTSDESIQYYGAAQLGNIIVVKYDSLANEKEKIPYFNLEEWTKLNEVVDEK